MKKASFSKRFISVILTVLMLSGIFSVGIGGIIAEARDVGINYGAEGFNPVKIYQREAVTNTTNVNTALVIQVVNADYQVKIHSIEVATVQDSANADLNVYYTSEMVIKAQDGIRELPVSGTISSSLNSPALYTIEYDILNALRAKLFGGTSQHILMV